MVARKHSSRSSLSFRDLLRSPALCRCASIRGETKADSLGACRMKALVLSGGAGTRLRPITHTSARQLLPVANKPVLFSGLEAIRDAGITEVGVIVGDTAEEIQAAAGHGSAFGPRVSYIRQKAPLGLAHAVLTARVHLGDDDFVMYVGEKSIGGGNTSLVEEFRSPDGSSAQTACDMVECF